MLASHPLPSAGEGRGEGRPCESRRPSVLDSLISRDIFRICRRRRRTKGRCSCACPRRPSTSSTAPREALGMRKKDLVAGLVTKYVDPDSPRGLSALGSLSTHKVTVDVGESSPTLGSYSFQPYDPPEVMNADQAGQFLQIDAAVVIEMAEAGKVAGPQARRGLALLARGAGRLALDAGEAMSAPGRGRLDISWISTRWFPPSSSRPTAASAAGTLLAPAQGPHHLPRLGDRRRRRQRRRRAVALPRVGRPRQGRDDVHQLAGRR